MDDEPAPPIPPLWNPEGDGLRGGRKDKPFEQLSPPSEKPALIPEDPPFTQPGPSDGSGDGGGGPSGGGDIPNVIIVFNGTAYYCDLAGNVTGPV